LTESVGNAPFLSDRRWSFERIDETLAIARELLEDARAEGGAAFLELVDKVGPKDAVDLMFKGRRPEGRKATQIPIMMVKLPIGMGLEPRDQWRLTRFLGGFQLTML
jgi:hypothetical protein